MNCCQLRRGSEHILEKANQKQNPTDYTLSTTNSFRFLSGAIDNGFLRVRQALSPYYQTFQISICPSPGRFCRTELKAPNGVATKFKQKNNT